MRTVTLLTALAAAMPAMAAIHRVGNTCTVTPEGAAARRRSVAAEPVPLGEPMAPQAAVHEKYPTAAGMQATAAPIVHNEVYPRPEPGSEAAQGYDRVDAAREAATREATLAKEMAKARAKKAKEEREAKAREEREGKGEGVKGVKGALNVRDTDEADAVGAVDATVDDTPQILEAFKQCGHEGRIVFTEGTYNIRQVMNTTGLRNVDIDLLGTFVWSGDNIQYWLSHSFSVTYAGRSTAWLVGGTNISMRGYGKALFNGNGQIWIDQNRGQGNQNGRPISLTIWHGTNVLVDGITWRMAQFWHTFVAHSQNVTMTNLDMNTRSSSQYSAVNTDGTDTWNSRDIVISNWTVKCGDVCGVDAQRRRGGDEMRAAMPHADTFRTASRSRATAPTCTCRMWCAVRVSGVWPLFPVVFGPFRRSFPC